MPNQSRPAVRHVALLRGINVGKAKRIAMADLRALVEGLGYRGVRTLLNSGNVVFDAPSSAKGDPAARIQKAIEAELGIVSRVTVIDAATVDAIVAKNPLHAIARDPSRLLVAVLNDPADLARVRPMTKQDWSPDALALGPRSAYLWCASGILESPLAKSFDRTFRDMATTRNWATFAKIQALCRANE